MTSPRFLVRVASMNAAGLAQAHWNNAPLYFSEEQRYSDYAWLCEAAEFRHHAGERVLEIGCGSVCDLLQFARNGAIATGVDITERHLELARGQVGCGGTWKRVPTSLCGQQLRLHLFPRRPPSHRHPQVGHSRTVEGVAPRRTLQCPCVCSLF